MKKVVVIGGGNGSAFSICALKSLVPKIQLSAVISMSDSTGSTGRLREEFKTMPPGDIMRATVAMSRFDYLLLKKIFYKNRFVGCGKLEKHNLGNLFLILSQANNNNDYVASIRALEQAVEAVGKVYPATLDRNDLVAELDNGDVVRTEGAIDVPVYDRKFKIKNVKLEPTATAYPDAIKALEEADYIILGPGSLHTSIIAALLPQGIKEAIGRSKAKLIYVLGNAINANGETGPETVSGLINTLNRYLPRKADIALLNSHKLSKEQGGYYDEKGWQELVRDKENWEGLNVVEADYERNGGGLSAERLGPVLTEILGY